MFTQIYKRWLKFITSGNLILRYIVIVGVIYIPTVLFVLHAGTFGPNSKVECEVPFIYDVTFHYSWGIAIPYFFLFLPWCYKSMDNVIDVFKKRNPPIIDENMISKSGRLGKRSFRCIISIVISLILVFFVGLMNIRSLNDDDKLYFWYFPSQHSWLVFAYFLVICSIATSVAFAALAKYVYTLRLIREGVLKLKNVPTWIGSPQGAVDRLFRSVFQLFIPCCIISILIIRSRIMTFQSGFDFTVFFNIFIIPIGIFITLIGPVVYSGIPSKFFAQRAKLLRKTDEEIAEIFLKLGSNLDNENRKSLIEKFEVLLNEKQLIRKNYPRLPIGSFTRLISAFPLTIPAFHTAIVVLGMIGEIVGK